MQMKWRLINFVRGNERSVYLFQFINVSTTRRIHNIGSILYALTL